MTVLVGIDFSRHSRRALDWAIDYALAREESLVIAHAFAGSRMALGVKEGHLDPIGQVEAELEMDDAITLSEKWARDAREAGLEVEIMAERAKEKTFLLDCAKKCHPSVIVMGSRGHGAIKRAVLGSVATAVIEQATCPVVVVPAKKS